MTRFRTVLIAAGAAAIALVATGCKDRSHEPLDAASLDRIEREQCLHYLEIKEPVLVKQCLDKKQLPADRLAEANAIMARATKARAAAIDRLDHADPAVFAIMKKWAGAKAADATLFVGINVKHAEPTRMMYGNMYTSEIPQNEIISDLQSMAKDKLPGVDFGNGGECDQHPHELDFAVTYMVRDSGDVNQLRHGSDTEAVHVLAYDFDIVACYEDQKTQVALVKDQKFPLSEGYAVQSDAGSVEYLGLREMDRHASAFVEGTIQAALGL